MSWRSDQRDAQLPNCLPAQILLVPPGSSLGETAFSSPAASIVVEELFSLGSGKSLLCNLFIVAFHHSSRTTSQLFSRSLTHSSAIPLHSSPRTARTGRPNRMLLPRLVDHSGFVPHQYCAANFQSCSDLE